MIAFVCDAMRKIVAVGIRRRTSSLSQPPVIDGSFPIGAPRAAASDAVLIDVLLQHRVERVRRSAAARGADMYCSAPSPERVAGGGESHQRNQRLLSDRTL